ncbi:hypothetical protein HZB89_00700, partial [archaeon]|nr:hypothetical protein [archaeon]
GKLKLKAIDKASKQGIENADAVLKKKNGAVMQAGKTDANGGIEFRIKKDEEYLAWVDRNDYLPKTITLSLQDNNKTIQLERMTTENTGIVEITVIDEYLRVVEGARVSLFDADTNLLYSPLEKLTDFNGIARFNGVAKGNYYGFAWKGLSLGKGAFFSLSEPKLATKSSVVIEFGLAGIKLEARNLEGLPVALAKISVFDVLGNKVRDDLTDGEGNAEFSLKAGQEVFFRVEKEGFAVFESRTMQLNKGQDKSLEFMLEPVPSKLGIELEGLYAVNGSKLAETINAGDLIEARFKVKADKGFDELNAVFRIGGKEFVESESAYISEVKAVNAVVSKYSKFLLNDAVNDLASATGGEAKLAKAAFGSVHAGVKEASVFFRARQGSMTGEQVKLFYRVEGVIDENGVKTVERMPFDEALSTSVNSPEKDSWYAESAVFILFIGKKADCTKDFCYSSALFDEQEDIYAAEKPFEASLYGKYRLEIELSNISGKAFNEADLRIKSKEKGLQIDSFEVVSGGQSEFKQNDGDKFELPAQPIGIFGNGEIVKIIINLQVVKEQANNIELRLISSSKEIFKKNEGINSIALKELELSFSPQIIVPLVEQNIRIQATDKATGLGVKDAAIFLEKDFSGLVEQGMTGNEGFLDVVLPASNPGSRINVEARKYSFKAEGIELPLDAKFIELPEQLGFALNVKTNQEDVRQLELNNKSAIEFSIANLSFSGLSAKYLDVQKMENYLLKHEMPPTALKKEQPTAIDLLAALNAEGKQLAERKEIEGELLIDVSYAGHSWPFSLPVNASIGLEGDVPEGCFGSTLSSWQETTEAGSAEALGELFNNCSVEGNEVTLKEVTAGIKWKGNAKGKFGIDVDGVVTGLSAFNDKIIAGSFESGGHLMKIIYTPEAGMLGEKAEAEIILTAVNATGGKEGQKLQKKINASIAVDNVQECVKPKTISLELDEGEEKSLELESTCQGNVEIQVESELKPSMHSLVLSAGETKAVSIAAIYDEGQGPCAFTACPGIYSVNISGKSAASNTKFKAIAVVP